MNVRHETQQNLIHLHGLCAFGACTHHFALKHVTPTEKNKETQTILYFIERNDDDIKSIYVALVKMADDSNVQQPFRPRPKQLTTI